VASSRHPEVLAGFDGWLVRIEVQRYRQGRLQTPSYRDKDISGQVVKGLPYSQSRRKSHRREDNFLRELYLTLS